MIYLRNGPFDLNEEGINHVQKNCSKMIFWRCNNE